MAINGLQIESWETKADLNDALANTPGQPIRMLPKKEVKNLPHVIFLPGSRARSS